jgi:hypothetical protein
MNIYNFFLCLKFSWFVCCIILSSMALLKRVSTLRSWVCHHVSVRSLTCACNKVRKAGFITNCAGEDRFSHCYTIHICWEWSVGYFIFDDNSILFLFSLDLCKVSIQYLQTQVLRGCMYTLFTYTIYFDVMHESVGYVVDQSFNTFINWYLLYLVVSAKTRTVHNTVYVLLRI